MELKNIGLHNQTDLFVELTATALSQPERAATSPSAIDRAVTPLSITMDDTSLHPSSPTDNNDSSSSSKKTKSHLPTNSSLSKISKLDVADPSPPRLPQAKATEDENATTAGLFTSDITMNALDEQEAIGRLICDLSKDEISLVVGIFGNGTTSSTTTKKNHSIKDFPKQQQEEENRSAFTRIVRPSKSHNDATIVPAEKNLSPHSRRCGDTSKPMLSQNQEQPHSATISPGVTPSLLPPIATASFQNPFQLPPWTHFHGIHPYTTSPPHLIDLHQNRSFEDPVLEDTVNNAKKLDRSKPRPPSNSEEKAANYNLPTNRNLANINIISSHNSNKTKIFAYISHPTKLGEAQWNRMYDKAKAFVKENGHSRIPVMYPENKALGQWAKRQRYHLKVWKKYFHDKQHNDDDDDDDGARLHDVSPFSPAAVRRKNPGVHIVKCLMTAQRLEKLEMIDFCADLIHANWEHHYKLLCEYASKHRGRTNPSKHTHMDLCKWVGTQRYQMTLLRRRNRGKDNTKQQQQCYNCNDNNHNSYGLSTERIRKLNAINFEWECEEYEVGPFLDNNGEGWHSFFQRK